MHGWRISPTFGRPAFSAASSFQIGVACGFADMFKRTAGIGFAATTFDLEPTMAPVEALRDGISGPKSPPGFGRPFG